MGRGVASLVDSELAPESSVEADVLVSIVSVLVLLELALMLSSLKDTVQPASRIIPASRIDNNRCDGISLGQLAS